jgi:hypothetical protein
MNSPIVPVEIARKLNELGFNEPCYGFYNLEGKYNQSYKHGMILKNSSITIPNCVAAPLYQSVCWWLLENYHCRIKFDYDYLMDISIIEILNRIHLKN